MKIAKIVMENDRVLGDITFDFTENNKVVNTIILAGENGTGKTRLLDIIYNFTNHTFFNYNEKTNEIYTFDIYLEDEEVLKLKQHKNLNINDMDGNIITIVLDKSMEGNYDKIIYKNNEGHTIEKNSFLYINENFRGLLLSVYSTTQVNFNVNKISSVTAKNLDEKLERSLIQNENIATEIAQLLVDIDTLDNSEIAKWVKEHPGEIVPEELIDTRMKRFKYAFDYMFPKKRMIGIKNIHGNKEVIFKENNLEMSINKLSSGEKQIVFRGGFLLKDTNSNKGIVLIDEPEISLHPTWQKKIVEFFRRLFQDENGYETNQIIMTTHSPFIIHNESRKNDKVIIIKKDENGKVIIDNEGKYYGWTTEKIIENAFNLDLFIKEAKTNNSKTTIITEGKTDWMHMKNAYDKLLKLGEIDDLNIEFLEYTDSLGDSRLYQLYENISIMNNDKKFICIFDRDKEDIVKKVTEGDKDYKFNKNNVYSMAIPVPNHRKNTPKICIEHYYLDEDIKREKNGKRIYIGNEFSEVSGIHKTAQKIFCKSKNKCGSSSYKIIDADCFVGNVDDESTNIAMSKNDFAKNIIEGIGEFSNIDINGFKELFNVISEIQSSDENR